MPLVKAFPFSSQAMRKPAKNISPTERPLFYTNSHLNADGNSSKSADERQ